MIRLFTGTPGSGKSYDAAREIVRQLKAGKPLIANYPVNAACVRNPRSKIEYWDNSEMSAARFVAYAREHHKFGKEGQTLVIIDECQVLFNCRDFGRKDRNGWVNLFAQHRKLGYDFILITQNDRFVDKQIRCLIEEEVKHRKLNNYGFGGALISLTMMTWFVSVTYWYGGNKALIGKSVFAYNRKYEKVYDSYRMFDGFEGLPDARPQSAGVCAGGDRAAVGPRGTAPAPAPGEGTELPPQDESPALVVGL